MKLADTQTQSIRKLRRFVQPPPAKLERCELCGAEIEPEHRHLVDMEKRQMMCACRPCYLLFLHRGAGAGKLQAVSERVIALPRVDLRGEFPVGMVFFIRDFTANRVKAFYPSPAGATESSVPAETWNEMVSSTPELETMEPGTEALLVSKQEAFIAPVDSCYELVGRIRKTWRGFDGGPDARREIDDFFSALRQSARRM